MHLFIIEDYGMLHTLSSSEVFLWALVQSFKRHEYRNYLCNTAFCACTKTFEG